MLSAELPPTVIKADRDDLAGKIYPISRLTKMFAVSARTIRFYCDVGLIEARRRGQERIFDRRNVHRLALVQIGADLGFTLRDIAAMLRDGTTGDDLPYLEIASDRMDQEIAFLTAQREKVAEQIRLLSAYREVPEPSPPAHMATSLRRA